MKKFHKYFTFYEFAKMLQSQIKQKVSLLLKTNKRLSFYRI
ncbi:hypothetical protein HCMG_01527 [Helicobacter canadensis MIT 98-5491]|nr:hypothetical protein HCMG_01527 [Helicobacter canadensis MIT 98-5491]